MLDPISSNRAATMAVLNAAGASSAQAQQITDPFARQLLSILQDSIGKLGLKAEKVEAAPVDPGATTDSSGAAGRQFFVTITEARPSALSAGCGSAPGLAAQSFAEPTRGEDGVIPVPEGMYENYPGWNPRCFATRETANWLAERVGGEVGTFQWKWTLDFEQPPEGYTVRVGDKEINAGALAMYFEPGRFVNPDEEAAAALYRAGIINDYVRQNWSNLIDGDAPAA
jgi:hypothetical protein